MATLPGLALVLAWNFLVLASGARIPNAKPKPHSLKSFQGKPSPRPSLEAWFYSHSQVYNETGLLLVLALGLQYITH